MSYSASDEWRKMERMSGCAFGQESTATSGATGKGENTPKKAEFKIARHLTRSLMKIPLLWFSTLEELSREAP